MTAQDLKNSILQLAVQGKLVPQDKDDQSITDLIKCLHERKRYLIDNNIIKIDKKHTADPFEDDDVPFEIPDTWKWMKLADIVSFSSGKTPARQDAASWASAEIPWVSISDMVDGGITESTTEKISQKALNEYFSKAIVPKDTILMSFKLTIGKISYLGIDAVHNEAIINISPFATGDMEQTLKAYLFRVLPLLANIGNFKNAVKGKTLNATSISNLFVPLPPLEEQKRIVAKIEELMPYIEEYGKAEEELSTLNAKFPEKLRKSILQLAVQGKLVSQSDTDEPASELLKRVKLEKQQLDRENKQRREMFLPISADDLTFELPKQWGVIRVGEAGIFKKGPFGSSLTKNIFVPKGENTIKVYEQKNAIQKDHSLGEYYITRDYFNTKMTSFEVHPGDVIVSCAGTIGETYMLPNEIEQGIINQALMRIRIVKSINLDYFLLYFDYVLKSQANASSKGSAIKNIPPFDIFKNLILPIPPIEEQTRIVACVEELLAICKQLES